MIVDSQQHRQPEESSFFVDTRRNNSLLYSNTAKRAVGNSAQKSRIAFSRQPENKKNHEPTRNSNATKFSPYYLDIKKSSG